jgi:hypothetical protein
MFTVGIDKTENISILKKLIKEKKAPHLNHVAASDLDLFKVSLPFDGDIGAKLQQNANFVEPLDDPLLILSQVFLHVEEDHLHLVIRAPTDGELFFWAVVCRPRKLTHLH